MLPTQPYYDTSITARPFDLTQARHYLEFAGYTPPTTNGVGTVTVTGTYADAQGNPLANVTLTLMQTTDNSTFPTGATTVSHFTTDINGFYSFTVNPDKAGTYYYYINDASSGTPVYQYVQSNTVTASSAISSSTIAIIVVAVVVVVVVIAAVMMLMKRKKK